MTPQLERNSQKNCGCVQTAQGKKGKLEFSQYHPQDFHTCNLAGGVLPRTPSSTPQSTDQMSNHLLQRTVGVRRRRPAVYHEDNRSGSSPQHSASSIGQAVRDDQYDRNHLSKSLSSSSQSISELQLNDTSTGETVRRPRGSTADRLEFAGNGSRQNIPPDSVVVPSNSKSFSMVSSDIRFFILI